MGGSQLGIHCLAGGVSKDNSVTLTSEIVIFSLGMPSSGCERYTCAGGLSDKELWHPFKAPRLNALTAVAEPKKSSSRDFIHYIDDLFFHGNKLIICDTG